MNLRLQNPWWDAKAPYWSFKMGRVLTMIIIPMATLMRSPLSVRPSPSEIALQFQLLY